MQIRNFANKTNVEKFHELEGRLCWSYNKDVIGLLLNVNTNLIPPVMDIFWVDGDYSEQESVQHLANELIKFSHKKKS